MDLADPAVSNQLAGAAEVPVRALLASRLPDDLVFLHSIGHRPALGYRQRERLLAIDILLGARRVDRDQGVPVIGSPYIDRVDVLASDDVAKILIALAALVLVVPVDPADGRLAAANRAGPITRPLLVDITDRDHAHPLVSQEATHPVGTIVAGSDEPDRRLIAGRVLPHQWNGRDGWDRDRRAGGLLQKATAGIRTLTHDELLSSIFNSLKHALS